MAARSNQPLVTKLRLSAIKGAVEARHGCNVKPTNFLAFEGPEGQLKFFFYTDLASAPKTPDGPTQITHSSGATTLTIRKEGVLWVGPISEFENFKRANPPTAESGGSEPCVA